MKMDRRKSSLSLGSRTRKNILKGKIIRKKSDGTDNFADYWTDDDSSSDLASESNSDHFQHQITASNRNVTSPLKSDEHNVKSWDKDVNRSSSKKQNLSQNVHHYATRSMVNKSNISSSSNDSNEEYGEESRNFKHLSSNADATRRHIKKTVVPSLSEKIVNEKMTKTVTAESEDTLPSSSFINISQRTASNKTIASPLKSVEYNVKSCDRNVNKSLIKKQNLSQNVTQSDATENMGNKSNISNRGKDINEEYGEHSSSFQHLSLKANVTGKHTKNTAVSPISISVKMKNGMRAVETVTPKSVLISKSINEDEIEANKSSNVSQHTTSNGNITSPLRSVENNIESSHKDINRSPAKKQKLFKKIQQDSRHISAGNVDKKSDISSRVKSIGEECSNSQNSASNACTTSEYTENATSPFGRSRKMEKMSSIQNNVPDNNHNTSDIRILRTKQKPSTKVIHNKSSFIVAESDGDVVHPLSEKTSNERNNSVELREKQVSNISMGILKKNKVRKIRQHLQEENTFAEYDEYDKKIMQMVDKSEKMKTNTSEISSGNEEQIAKVPSEEKKSRTSKFGLKRKSAQISNSSSKKHVSGRESHNRPYSVLKASETFKATNKNATETDEFDDEAASDFDNYRKASVNTNNETFSKAADTSVNESDEPDEEAASDFDNYRKAPVNTNNETFSKAADMGVNESDEPDEAVSGFDNYRKAQVNKNNETFSKSRKGKRDSGHKSVIETDEAAASGFDNYRKAQVNKNNETLSKVAHKNVMETYEFGEEAALDFDNYRKAQVNKNNETFSKIKKGKRYSGRKGVTETDEPDAETATSFDNYRKTQVNKNNETFSKSARKYIIESHESDDEATSGFDDYRKAQRDKTLKNIDASTSSFNDTAEIPEVDNLTAPSLRSKRKNKGKYVNKNNENICVGNDQIQLSKGKKGRAKKTVDAVGCSVRRSTRQKFRPLAHWRNERLLYRTEKGVINFVGIDKGTYEDDGAIKYLENQLYNKGGKSDKRFKKSAKFKLNDVVQKKEINLTVMKKFADVPWEKILVNNKYPYCIKKLFETENSAFGFIQIEKKEEKPLQYMPSDDVYLSVMRGKVQLGIQDNICTVEERDMVVVPRCMPYSIKNIGRTRALLVFCIGRFRYVEISE